MGFDDDWKSRVSIVTGVDVTMVQLLRAIAFGLLLTFCGLL